MKNVICHTWHIFKKNKECIYLITIQPIVIFLLMSFLLPYTTQHQIGVVDQRADKSSIAIIKSLEQLDGINVQSIPYDQMSDKLMQGNVELVIHITSETNTIVPQVNLISSQPSEIESVIALCIKNASLSPDTQLVTTNPVPQKGASISNTLGFMIFKTLTAGNLLAVLLIQERNRKMKDRILLSGIKTSTYICGTSLVYLCFMLLGSIVYYTAGLFLHFDFGMKNSLGFLLMLFAANILSISLYVFTASLLKKEALLNLSFIFMTHS